jgi:hypothetical protein
MKLVDGVHHVTFLTEDIDRLPAFYERVLEGWRTVVAPTSRKTCRA